MPSNFEHRVHTGFDKREQRYVGLPLQWASIVGNNQILKSTNRPLPLVDPSEITPTEILDLKTIVRPHHNNQRADTASLNSSITLHNQGAVNVLPALVNSSGNAQIFGETRHDGRGDDGSNSTNVPPLTGVGGAVLVLPKTSHVARSNSLRSSSPPRIRRDLRGNANVPPAVPEEVVSSQNTGSIGFKTPLQPLTVSNMVGGGGIGNQPNTNGGPLTIRPEFSSQPHINYRQTTIQQQQQQHFQQPLHYLQQQQQQHQQILPAVVPSGNGPGLRPTFQTPLNHINNNGNPHHHQQHLTANSGGTFPMSYVASAPSTVTGVSNNNDHGMPLQMTAINTLKNDAPAVGNLTMTANPKVGMVDPNQTLVATAVPLLTKTVASRASNSSGGCGMVSNNNSNNNNALTPLAGNQNHLMNAANTTTIAATVTSPPPPPPSKQEQRLTHEQVTIISDHSYY